MILFPSIYFFAFVVFKLKALKNTVLSSKDRILQYHAVYFRVLHQRIDKITEGGLFVNAVKVNVQLYWMAWSSEFLVHFVYLRAVCP